MSSNILLNEKYWKCANEESKRFMLIIKDILNKKEFTQRELAKKIDDYAENVNFTASRFHKLRNGEAKVSDMQMKAITVQFGYSYEYLKTGKLPMKGKPYSVEEDILSVEAQINKDLLLHEAWVKDNEDMLRGKNVQWLIIRTNNSGVHLPTYIPEKKLRQTANNWSNEEFVRGLPTQVPNVTDKSLISTIIPSEDLNGGATTIGHFEIVENRLDIPDSDEIYMIFTKADVYFARLSEMNVQGSVRMKMLDTLIEKYIPIKSIVEMFKLVSYTITNIKTTESGITKRLAALERKVMES